jgi:hypothetical protein
MNTMLKLGIVAILFVTACGSSSKDAETPQTDGDTPVATTADPAPADQTTASGAPCQTDADCVPAECCHPKACVIKSKAPDNCADMMCTAECVEGTMDCGKGSCGCKEGECVVNWAG